MKGHAIIGFNHGVLGLAENPALGPGFLRQNTSGYALGVLTPKASPEGWVFSQAQHPMIKTYIQAWISNHLLSKGWDEITYPFQNVNGATGEFLAQRASSAYLMTSSWWI